MGVLILRRGRGDVVDGIRWAWYSDSTFWILLYEGTEEEFFMPKNWMRSALAIITYTVLLVLALVKFDQIMAVGAAPACGNGGPGGPHIAEGKRRRGG